MAASQSAPGPAGQPRRPGARPGRLAAAAVQAAELIQGHLQLDLGGLPGPGRDAPRRDQPPAGLLQRIVAALPHGPGVLGPGPLAQRLQHRRQRRGALRGQAAGQAPGTAERHIQVQRPAGEPVIPAVTVRAGGPAAHLLRQRGQISQVRAARRRGQQDLISRPAAGLRQQLTPPADMLRPGTRQLTASQRAGDRRMRGQPPHPPHRAGRGTPGDPGLPRQPRLRRPVPIVLAPATGVERRQDLGPRRDMHRLSPLQNPQALRLLRRGQRRRIHRRKIPQRGLRHRRSTHRTARRGTGRSRGTGRGAGGRRYRLSGGARSRCRGSRRLAG